MKKLLTGLFLPVIALPVAAQTSEKLTGTIIGTEICVDNNTAENLFDNNFNTYFHTDQRSGGWAGLDLGEKHVITKVAYCPADRPERLVLAVFEGANNPDFGDAIPLLLVTEEPPFNQMTEENVNCSRGFRYVRYVGPYDARCKLSELAFYGYKSNGNNSKLYQPANLPVVTIHTVDAIDIADPYKEVYRNGIISVISKNGTTIHTDSLQIKGRGNWSWSGAPKKPYRIKLYKKAALLEMPAKLKSWTLIPNYGDKTLLRNLFGFEVSKRLEMPYSPAAKPVDVFLNGEYKGVYNLSDHIQVNPGRVEIDEMTAKDIPGQSLTGGYLVEIDAYAESELKWFYSQNYVMPVRIKSPDEKVIGPIQENYIKDHFNKLTSVVKSANYASITTGFRRYLDTETFLRYFFMGEFFGHTDAYWSVNMYKKRSDDKFYVGPVWDLDLGFGNDHRMFDHLYHALHLHLYYNDDGCNEYDWVYNRHGSGAGECNKLVERIMSDPKMTTDLKAIYAKYRDNGALSEASLLEIIDNFAAEINESQTLNFLRWPIMNVKVHENPMIHGSYQAEVDFMKEYVSMRLAWMDHKLSYVPNAIHAVEKLPYRIWSENNGLHIELDNLQPVQCEIIDVTGKRIESRQITGSQFISLPQGIYFIRANGKFIQKCII